MIDKTPRMWLDRWIYKTNEFYNLNLGSNPVCCLNLARLIFWTPKLPLFTQLTQLYFDPHTWNSAWQWSNEYPVKHSEVDLLLKHSLNCSLLHIVFYFYSCRSSFSFSASSRSPNIHPHLKMPIIRLLQLLIKKGNGNKSLYWILESICASNCGGEIKLTVQNFHYNSISQM